MYTAEQIKPKRYPENKPSEDGTYWVHTTIDDGWQIGRWFEVSHWSTTVDYFIPYRLDEPLGNSEQLESEEMMSEDSLQSFVYSKVSEYVRKRNEQLDNLILEYLASHSELKIDDIELVESRVGNTDVVWYVREKEKREPEILPCPVCGWPNINAYSEPGEPEWYFVICHNCNIRTDGYLSEKTAIEAWNALPRYDVTRRETEILPCPFCGGRCIIKPQVNQHGDNFYNVVCVSNAEGCGYESKWLNVKSEAIRLHNLIARGEK